MITIERNALRAVASATAGTGASRPPLAGVLLEVIGDKIVGVATNGHILMASEVGQVSEKDDKLPPKMWLSCNTLRELFVGLIMPLRVTNNDTEETHHCLPSWLNRR